MGVSKNRGKTPKMDGENNGKPYEQIDDLGVPLFFGNTHLYIYIYLEPKWPLFLKVNPPKQCLFQSK